MRKALALGTTLESGGGTKNSVMNSVMKIVFGCRFVSPNIPYVEVSLPNVMVLEASGRYLLWMGS